MSRWRAASLIGVHLLAAIHFLHWRYAGETLAPVEPSEMFDTLHRGVITVGFLFMAACVVTTAIAGRFFCGWGCHILALQDLCAWILRRLNLPTRPIRSRTLVWIPAAAALYLFVWPQVERALAGQAPATLHVVTDRDGWTSFLTDDLLRSFPGPMMTVTTLAVCGYGIVVFLGSRSFCAYACPYGAIFSAVDRVAPLRIVAGSGECSSCGACIASCESSVRVIEEVRRHGAVTNANCMKDLDCVSVCPTDALKLGFAKPTVLRTATPRKQRPYDFTKTEDLLLAAVFIGLLPFVRGLYDAVSFLLALAATALLAYAAVIGLRLVRNDRVWLLGVPVKAAGRLTPRGRLAAGGLALLGGVVAHSVFVQGNVMLAKRALPAARAGDSDATQTAIARLETAQRWGVSRPRIQTLTLAGLYEASEQVGQARRLLNARLAASPGDHEARLQLAHSWRKEGREGLARSQAELVASYYRETPPARSDDRRLAAASHQLLGDLEVARGDRPAAISEFERAVALRPRSFEPRMALGALLAATNRHDAAIKHLRAAVDLEPGSPVAHNNLAAAFARSGRRELALESYRECLSLAPDSVVTLCNAAALLLEMGRLDEAKKEFKEALRRQPDCAEAQAGLRRIDGAQESVD